MFKNILPESDRSWLDDDTWLSVPQYMRGHIAKRHAAAVDALAMRLEYTEVLAADLGIKAGRLSVALDGQEQYRELRRDVLDAMSAIVALPRRFEAGELP